MVTVSLTIGSTDSQAIRSRLSPFAASRNSASPTSAGSNGIHHRGSHSNRSRNSTARSRNSHNRSHSRNSTGHSQHSHNRSRSLTVRNLRFSPTSGHNLKRKTNPLLRSKAAEKGFNTYVFTKAIPDTTEWLLYFYSCRLKYTFSPLRR
jgi:hypothetical protein